MTLNLPDGLIPLYGSCNWVGYRKQLRGDKITKVPIDPATGKGAKANDPTTWNTYQAACAAVDQYQLDGIGIQLGNVRGLGLDDTVLVGIDFDHVIDGSGQLQPYAQEIINALDSYTEYSPSGSGLHVLCFASADAVEDMRNGHSDGHELELYTRDRYFTITGKPYGTPKDINKRDNVLHQLHGHYFKPKEQPTEKAPSPVVMPSTDWSDYVSANLADMLQAISSEDQKTWIAVGIALKSAGFDFETFDAWSRKDYTPKKGETARIWKSWTRLNPAADAMKALYLMAKQGGWNPPREGMPQRDTITNGHALTWDGSIEALEGPSDGSGAKMDKNTTKAAAAQDGPTAPTVEGITAKPSTTTGGAAPAAISKPRKLAFLTADDIAEMDIEPVSIIIPGFLTEGTFVMGCYSGGGKTWLAMQLAKSVATGCDFLGVTPTRTGKVLFLEMELGISVIKERMTKVGMTGKDIFFMHSDLKTSTGESALPGRKENLTEYLDNVSDQLGGGIALVVVDVWRNLKRPTPRGEDPDTVIYDQVGEINAFCNKHHAAVMILHHTRKASKESAFQETRSDGLSGSNALAGAMKGGVWMIGGKENEPRSLYVQLKAAAGSGEHAIAFDRASCSWSLDGNIMERKKQEYMSDPVRLAILAMIGTDSQIKLTSQEISEKITEMDGGSYTRLAAPDVGKRINIIRADMARYDRLEVGQRTGKTDKYYPIKRIKDYALNFDGTPEETTEQLKI